MRGRTVLLIVATVALAVLLLWLWGTRQRDAGVKDAERKASRTLADSNRAWSARWQVLRDSIVTDTVEVARIVRHVDTVEADIARNPPPEPGTVTDSALAEYWKGVAEKRRTQVADLRNALSLQKEAFGRLLAAADDAAGRLDTTTAHLTRGLDREADAGKFTVDLGLFDLKLPKPPKWAAATIGCTAGGLAGRALSASRKNHLRDAATGCAAGAAVTTVLTPTD